MSCRVTFEKHDGYRTTRCETCECFLTVGLARGYGGAPVLVEEARDAIAAFQKRFEDENGYCCAVRVLRSEILYQGYREDCLDVRVINYPRYATEPAAVARFVRLLALELMGVLDQERITMVAPGGTEMFEKNGADESRVHDLGVDDE